MTSFFKTTLGAIFLATVFSLGLVLTFEHRVARAAVSDNVIGWAWSDNIGWISLNCTNTSSCATSDYGVTVNPSNGGMTGYAWSDNIGWIQFNGIVNLGTGAVSGWASALSADNLGWDGQINLSGLTLSGTSFSGFAWGSDVVGWVDFNGVNTTVMLLVPRVTITANPGTNVMSGTVVTLSWTSTSGATSCTLTGGGLNITGLPANGSYNLGALTQSAVYTITCTNAAGGSGSGNITISIQGPPSLMLSPTNLSFGTVAVNEIKDSVDINPTYLTITNTGGGTLTITGISSSFNFSCVSGCTGTLAAGASQLAIIRLVAPATPQSLGESIRVNSSAGDQMVTVNATIVPQITTNGPLDFGNVFKNKTKDMTLTIRNNSEVNTISAGIVSIGSPYFSCISCDYPNIPPGGTVEIIIRFAPGVSTGVLNATAMIGETGVVVELSGTGLSPAFKFKEK